MRDHCAHCRQPKPERERWHVHTGPAKNMRCCQRCKPGLDAGAAPEFHVERNYRKAGTSSGAAQSAAKSAKLNDTHRKIYAALRDEPMTADEVAKECGLVLNTARARLTDLKNAGHIEPTGEKRTTDAGRPAEVMRVVRKQERAA